VSTPTSRRRLVVVLTWIILPVDILSACEHWIIVIVLVLLWISGLTLSVTGEFRTLFRHCLLEFPL